MLRQHRKELPDNEFIRVATLAELKKLNDLGSPTRIAYFLMDSGVHGMRHDSMRCPVGAYISKVLGGTTTTWMSPMWGCVYSDKRPCAVWRVPVSLRDYVHVRSFIKGFDDGWYTALVDNVMNLR